MNKYVIFIKVTPNPRIIITNYVLDIIDIM